MCDSVLLELLYFPVIHNRDIVEPRYDEVVEISTIPSKLYYTAVPQGEMVLEEKNAALICSLGR